ncbi:MAG: mevalonate kinase [Anaerolineae bacterium]|nr:mevalonate kinase [Anaerolineae bacterium]
MSSRAEFQTTAPGKVILLGEHAVVYGQPALAVPVTSVSVTVTVTPAPDLVIEAPDLALTLTAQDEANHLDHPLFQMVHRVAQRFGHLLPRQRFRITSTIPFASGLGSGAAVSAALGRAAAQALGQRLSDDELNAMVYDIERIHHGTPSGIDNTVIVYQKPVYFIRGQGAVPFEVGVPFTILIADTGQTALTRESVGDVRHLMESAPDRYQPIVQRIGQVVESARAAIALGQHAQLGALMDENHALLDQLTVSSPQLDRLVTAARQAGALGAKLSGGGRGGNMIALVTPDSSAHIADALRHAGAVRVLSTVVSNTTPQGG